MTNNIKIGIVGAGIQGVSNALFLQKKGFDVTIFDRDEELIETDVTCPVAGL